MNTHILNNKSKSNFANLKDVEERKGTKTAIFSSVNFSYLDDKGEIRKGISEIPSGVKLFIDISIDNKTKESILYIPLTTPVNIGNIFLYPFSETMVS